MTEIELTSPAGRARKKRLNKAPEPRFKPDISEQFDLVLGCPAAQLPADHEARRVKALVARLDVRELEAKYSSQGRRGFHPHHMLGALIYGSMRGLHESTKLARALRTDLALRFVAGGHEISEGRLRAFRRENLKLFQAGVQQTIAFAQEAGLVDPRQLAVDSVRLRAHASTKAVRTEARSQRRLSDLSKVDVPSLTEEEREEHTVAIEKHRAAIELCRKYLRPNFVMTSPSAGLMKFPSGASAPGHRATVVAVGVKTRFVIDVLVDGDATDYGKLGPAVHRARAALKAAGVPLDEPMQLAADAGYFSAADLAFASENKKWVDVLIDEGRRGRRKSESGEPIFSVDDFERRGEAMFCPAGTQMSGPFSDGGRERWHGNGCARCGLKPQCTKGTYRALTIDRNFIALRDQMRQRFELPGARSRYNKRIATVEPVFSHIEANFGFRRVSSRFEETVKAEVLLKVLAYNMSRLITAKRLRRVLMWVDASFLSGSSGTLAS